MPSAKRPATELPQRSPRQRNGWSAIQHTSSSTISPLSGSSSKHSVITGRRAANVSQKNHPVLPAPQVPTGNAVFPLPDPDTTYCLIKPISPQAILALHLPQNAANRVSVPPRVDRAQRAGTPLEETEISELFVLSFSDKSFDATQGHVFGSQEEPCDILLDVDRKHRVSGQHFSLRLDYKQQYPDKLRIVNLSRNFTKVDGVVVKGVDSIDIEPGRTVTVIAGEACLDVEFLSYIGRNPAYLERWNRFRRAALADIPLLNGMAIHNEATPALEPLTQGDSITSDSSLVHRINQRVGKGAEGRVFQGYDTENERIVCIKVLSPDSSRDEIRIMSRLRHERIVQFLDSGDRGGTPFLVLEYHPYQSLDKYMKVIIMGEYSIRRLASQMLEALVYLHDEQSVALRDIMPENVLLAGLDPEEFKLADFGISKQCLPSRAPASSFVGTIFYMAPEIFPEKDLLGRELPVEYDTRADLWSLGAVLVHAATEDAPIVAEMTVVYDDEGQGCRNSFANAMAQRDGFETYEPDAEVLKEKIQSPHGIELILGLLQKDPCRRPSAATCLQSAWFSAQIPAPAPLDEPYVPSEDLEDGPFIGTVIIPVSPRRGRADLGSFGGSSIESVLEEGEISSWR